MILRKMPEVDYFEVASVVCFTETGELILLEKRPDHPIYPGQLGVPTGKKKKKDTTIKETAIREVLEETGNQIQLADLSFFSLNPIVHFKRNSERFYFFCFTYYLNRGRFLNEVIINPDEHGKVIKINPKEALKMDRKMFVPDAQEIIRDFYVKQLLQKRKEDATCN